jgi:hypothetical protein
VGLTVTDCENAGTAARTPKQARIAERRNEERNVTTIIKKIRMSKWVMAEIGAYAKPGGAVCAASKKLAGGFLN